MKLIDGRPMWDFRARAAYWGSSMGGEGEDNGVTGNAGGSSGAGGGSSGASGGSSGGGSGSSGGSMGGGFGGGYDSAPVSHAFGGEGSGSGAVGAAGAGSAPGMGMGAGMGASMGGPAAGPSGVGAGAPAEAYASLAAPKGLMETMYGVPVMNAPVAAPPTAAPVGPPGNAGFATIHGAPGFGNFGVIGAPVTGGAPVGPGNPGTIGAAAMDAVAHGTAGAPTVGHQSGIGQSIGPGTVGIGTAPSAVSASTPGFGSNWGGEGESNGVTGNAGGKDQSQAPSISGAPAPTGISVPGMNYGGAVPGVGSGLMSFAEHGPVSAPPGSPALGLAEVPSGANASLAPAGASAPAPAPAAVAAQEYGTPAPASSLTMETNTGLAVPNTGGGVDFAIDTQLTPIPGIATAIDALVGMAPVLGIVNAASGLLGYGSIGSAMAANPHNEAWGDNATTGDDGGPGWMDSATSDYDRGLTTSPDADAKLRNDIFYRLDLYTSGVSPYERFHASRQPYRSV